MPKLANTISNTTVKSTVPPVVLSAGACHNPPTQKGSSHHVFWLHLCLSHLLRTCDDEYE
jgi:hypothetical protein